LAEWREWALGELKTLGDDEKKASQWINRHNTFGDFMKAQMNLRDTMENRIPLPKPDAKPEVWHEIYRRLGKPDRVEDYKITRPEGVEEPQGFEAELEKNFLQFAHQKNLTQAQVQEIFNWQHQQSALLNDQRGKITKDFLDRSKSELKKEWGPEFDENIANANAAIKMYLGEKYETLKNKKFEDGGYVFDDPDIARMFAAIGRERSEDIRAHGIVAGDDRASLDEQISRIRQEALDKGKLPSDPEFHTKLQPLYEKRYGNKKMSPTGPQMRARS
jgi:hypothetical protein